MRKRLSKNLVCQMTLSVGTVILVALMLVVFRAWAMPAAPNQGPGVISYQGTLSEPGGQPVDGDLDMTFGLFDGSTGGTALWTEAHAGANAVPVSEGLFNVLLGSLSPIPATVWDNASLFLEVTVGGEVLAPREAVGSVPHALYAVHAELAYNLSAADGDPVHAATVDDDGAVHIEGGGDASLAGGGRLVLGPTSGSNIALDENEIMARHNGESSTLYLQHEGGDLDVGGKLLGNGNELKYHYHRRLNWYQTDPDGDKCHWWYRTGYSIDDFVCGLTGYYADGGDIDEGSGFRTQARMLLVDQGSGLQWEAHFEASCDDSWDNVYVDYLCIPQNLVDWGWPD